MIVQIIFSGAARSLPVFDASWGLMSISGCGFGDYSSQVYGVGELPDSVKGELTRLGECSGNVHAIATAGALIYSDGAWDYKI